MLGRLVFTVILSINEKCMSFTGGAPIGIKNEWGKNLVQTQAHIGPVASMGTSEAQDMLIATARANDLITTRCGLIQKLIR